MCLCFKEQLILFDSLTFKKLATDFTDYTELFS
jgi:hypothetical protein